MANVTVRLAVGNFSVEVTGEAEYVDKKIDDMVSRYLSWRPSAAAAPAVEATSGASAPSTEATAAGKPMSPGEFVKKSGAKNQMDRTLVLGYYLEKISGSSGFSSSELVELGRQIKQPFSNVSENISRLTSRGLMMSAGNKEGNRAYALTASGEAYVESLLESKPKE